MTDPDTLARLKRSRAAHRGVATKYLQEANVITGKSSADINQNELIELVRLQQLLCKKSTELADKDAKVEDAVAADDLDDEVRDASDKQAIMQNWTTSRQQLTR